MPKAEFTMEKFNKSEDRPEVPEGHTDHEILGMHFVLPDDMGWPEGYNVLYLVQGFIEAGALEIVKGKLVKVEGSRLEEGKVAGLQIGGNNLEDSRMLTDEEVAEDWKKRQN